MIYKDSEWIKICDFDEQQEICFTKEYLELMAPLGSGARKFASHLISHWDLEFQTLLDYFGSGDAEVDKYTGIDGEPMDVREDITDLWEYYGKPYDGLEAEWYRDVLRAKLVTLKLPKKVIEDYVKVAKKHIMKGAK